MCDSTAPQSAPTGYQRYLWLPRRKAPETFEDFLGRLAGLGYLLIGVAEDVAAHGDVQFLQTRRAPKSRQSGEQYWQQHALLHQQLCSMGLKHMPVGLGPGPDEPFALAWLLPAPADGKLIASAGFEQTVDLTEGQRDAWLDWVARQLSTTNARTAQRVLLQPPGAQRPAYWHYGSYRGDAPIEGSPAERLRTLLSALPRYARNFSTEVLTATPDEAGAWPFLLNQPPTSSMDGMGRAQFNRELFLIN